MPPQADRPVSDARFAAGLEGMRALAETSSMLVWLADTNGDCIYFNAAWTRFTGRTQAQEAGSGWLDSVHADDRAALEELYRTARERRESFRTEYRLRNAAGEYRWVSDDGNPLYCGGGNLLGYVGFCSDITERKRAEVALDRLATRYAQLSGPAFYEAVCRHLAEALQLDYVFVGELSVGGSAIDVRGGWADGEPMPALSYELAGSPCAGVLERNQCAYSHKVASTFPADTMLGDLGIEGYCGTPLLDADGRPFGLMVGLSRQPIADVAAVHRLMDVFDDRVGAEMQREKAEAALNRRIGFERLVSDVSGQLIVVQSGAFDAAIETALGQIGEFVDADRVYVFMMREGSILIDNTHEWCGPGIHPEIHNLQDLPFDNDMMFSRMIRAHAIVDIPDVSKLPDSARTDREILAAQSIRSTLAVPMVSSRLLGFIGLDAVRAVRPWTDEDKTLLKLACNAFTSVFERKLMDESLRRSESRYRSVVENIRDVIFQLDGDGRWVFLNAAWTDITGFAVTETLGRSFCEFSVTGEEGDWRMLFESLVADPDGECRREVRCRCKDGSTRWLDVYLRVAAGSDGSVRGVSGTLNDITERKRAIDRQKLVASVFTHANEGIMITDAAANIIEVNETFSRITGYAREEVIGRSPRKIGLMPQNRSFFREMYDALQDCGQWQGELWNRRRNSEEFAALLKVSALRDERGRIQQYVALFSDITAQKRHESQLEYIAHYDALTGLPNRVLLQDRLKHGMAQARRRLQQLAVVYIDLDGFKAVNDRYGHHVGDQLLMALAMRMKAMLREGDSIARLGGDEFVAVLVDLADLDTCMPLVLRLLTALARPVTVAGHDLRVSASIGLTLYPQSDDVDADQLLRQADLAMYQAKLAGKNRYHVFDTAADRSARGHHETVARIRKGLKDGEFVLYYQPKVNMRTGAVVGAEALIRWQHPVNGLVSPAAFLPVIEDHPVAVQLGEWVIDAALAQVVRWRAEGLDLPVSVNIGARHLQDPSFMDRLRELLADHAEVPPRCLELEVLETSALESMAHVSRIVEACAEIGVPSALDDFGTGYSSLAYLKRLPAAILKIDQLFVRDMLDDPDDLAILEAVLGLASAFRRGVVAEGVETAAHGKLLLQLGCEIAQGFGIARPMPAHEMCAWVSSWTPPASWRQARPIRREDLPLVYAIVEHRATLIELDAFLSGSGRRVPAHDAAADHLRHWLNGAGRRRLGLEGAVSQIASLHTEVHARVSALIDEAQNGRRMQARTGLDAVRALGEQLIAELEYVLELSA